MERAILGNRGRTGAPSQCPCLVPEGPVLWAMMGAMELLVADRSDRGKLRFTGEQRLWFLHQILTQAFEDIQPGEARDAAILTAKGRMRGYMEVVATDDELLMHFEAELLETLPEEIARYVFATRVEIEDVTASQGLVLIVGEGWERATEGLAGVRHPTHGLGIDAGYLWVPAAAVRETVEAIVRKGARLASEDELESVRIDGGVARWGRDMDFASFPQEANVDEIAVHYQKGCYTGQEAMAKIHLRGKVNRHLRRVSTQSAVEPGAEVTLEGVKAGVVTSASAGSSLAMLKHTVEPGQNVQIGDVLATVES
jgi:folate-binding protein YgfZ